MGPYYQVSFLVALGRLFLSLVVAVGGFIALDVMVYLGAIGSMYNNEVSAAFSEGYELAYTQTYEVGYQEAHSVAYDKGYEKGFEIGMGSESQVEVSGWVGIHNPTYAELKAFLAADKTDSNLFISGEYVCFDFAAELNNNAEANGIRAAYVRIRSDEWAHAVVAFETVDKGLVFIEPQSDMTVDLIIGKPYPWWLAGAASPLRYTDALEEIQIIW